MSEKYKVLIGYDGSDYAKAAIADLEFAGLPANVEVTVCCVSDVWQDSEITERVYAVEEKPSSDDLEIIKSHLIKATSEGLKLAEQGAALVKKSFPEWDVNAQSLVGKPAWEIIEQADKNKTDLIIVGSKGRTALGRVLLGSVSQKILNEAHCSVRIARKRQSEIEKRLRILIACDGSEFAENAARIVAGRNWTSNTEFRIITADDNPASRPEISLIDYVPEGKKDSPKALEWIERVIKTPAKILKDAGLNPSQFVRWGDARGIILYEAERWKADAIFMGARGLGRFKRFLLGSVSSSVAAKADCSVEIVR